MNQNIENNSHRGSKSGRITFRTKQSKHEIDMELTTQPNPLYFKNLVNSNIIDSKTSEIIKNTNGDKKIKIEDIHSLRKTARDVGIKGNNGKRYIINNYDIAIPERNTSPNSLFDQLNDKNKVNSVNGNDQIPNIQSTSNIFYYDKEKDIIIIDDFDETEEYKHYITYKSREYLYCDYLGKNANVVFQYLPLIPAILLKTKRRELKFSKNRSLLEGSPNTKEEEDDEIKDPSQLEYEEGDFEKWSKQMEEETQKRKENKKLNFSYYEVSNLTNTSHKKKKKNDNNTNDNLNKSNYGVNRLLAISEKNNKNNNNANYNINNNNGYNTKSNSNHHNNNTNNNGYNFNNRSSLFISNGINNGTKGLFGSNNNSKENLFDSCRSNSNGGSSGSGSKNSLFDINYLHNDINNDINDDIIIDKKSLKDLKINNYTNTYNENNPNFNHDIHLKISNNNFNANNNEKDWNNGRKVSNGSIYNSHNDIFYEKNGIYNTTNTISTYNNNINNTNNDIVIQENIKSHIVSNNTRRKFFIKKKTLSVPCLRYFMTGNNNHNEMIQKIKEKKLHEIGAETDNGYNEALGLIHNNNKYKIPSSHNLNLLGNKKLSDLSNHNPYHTIKISKFNNRSRIIPKEKKIKNKPINKSVIQPRLNSSMKQDSKKIMSNDYRPKSDMGPSLPHNNFDVNFSPMISPSSKPIELLGSWK
eukprot:TRINITY_DN7236_c0_g1_i1.p1 TRINITY_DN7236_c0_g1~~TRINITY_DN7236_c0_g1_i1.p1  ORF type:complete len:697 (+),score=191.62 TRINITY_DN7236_c0_g1_i1:207-2297(+)